MQGVKAASERLLSSSLFRCSRRKWAIAGSIGALVVLSCVTFALSIFFYGVASFMLIPRMQCEFDLVLAPPTQYDVRLGNVTVHECLSHNTRYTWDLYVHWPEKEVNMRGEKIVGLILEDEYGNIVWAGRRSFLMVYKSRLRLLSEKLVWFLPLALGWVDEAQYCTTQVAKDVMNPGKKQGISLARVELDGKAEVYSTKLIARATLHGIAYFWYHWRVTTLCFVVATLWTLQMSTAVVVLGLVLWKTGLLAAEEKEEARRYPMLGQQQEPTVAQIESDAVQRNVLENDEDDGDEDVSIDGSVINKDTLLQSSNGTESQSRVRHRKKKKHHQQHQHQQQQDD